ncbi:MAG: S9 family peptidase [Cyanobacteriota bacterium]
MEELKLIPKKVLFGNPVKTSPQISPNAKMMSYLAPVDNVLNVWIGEIGSDNYQSITSDKDRGVMNYFWGQDNENIFYLQDKNGNENWRLYSVNINTKEIKDYTPFEEVQVQILANDKNFPNEMLLSINKDNAYVHDVYHLNLLTSELKKIEENPGNVAHWEVDNDLKIKGATISNEDGSLELIIKNENEKNWKSILKWEMEDSLNSSSVAFSKDGKFIYLIDSRDFNSGRLVKVNIESGEKTIILEDPSYDVSRVMIHPDTYEIQMATLVKSRNENYIFDQSIKEDINNIGQLNPGDFVVYDRDNADKIWLVGFTQDIGSVSFYLYDRDKKEGQFLFYSKPDLNTYTLSKMNPLMFTSRDGLRVHGYISYPPNKEIKNLPLVVNVHGGPWFRDSWGYNPEAQLFANRGYACLQVNFRGSTGYGKSFLNAGDKEWGGKMHDDLLDAIDLLVKKGDVDPNRIAIYGGSYGGYAALVGATFTPDVFKCAIDVVGPSSIITLIENIPPYWSTFLANFKKRVGDPETEDAFLKSRSPLFHVENIKIPVLIAQGANDPRVKQSESEQIVEAMKNKGLEYEYLLFEDEGHGFVKPENRIKFYSEAEKFLAKHLGGRSED